MFLQSSTEQQASCSALTSAAVHKCCITAQLHEQQTSIGVIAVAMQGLSGHTHSLHSKLVGQGKLIVPLFPSLSSAQHYLAFASSQVKSVSAALRNHPASQTLRAWCKVFGKVCIRTTSLRAVIRGYTTRTR